MHLEVFKEEGIWHFELSDEEGRSYTLLFPKGARRTTNTETEISIVGIPAREGNMISLFPKAHLLRYFHNGDLELNMRLETRDMTKIRNYLQSLPVKAGNELISAAFPHKAEVENMSGFDALLAAATGRSRRRK